MGRRSTNLPPFVRRHGTGFRAVLTTRNQQRHYGPTRDTAHAAAEYALHWRNGARTQKATLQECFDALLREAELKNLRPATVKFYRNHWRILIGPFGWQSDIPVHRITVEQVEAYVGARQAANIKPSTIWTKEVFLLQRALNHAKKKGLITNNPIAGIEAPKIRKQRFPCIAEDVIENLIAAMRKWPGRFAARDADIVTVFAGTGLRRAEVARLRPQDVSFDTKTIRVDGKTENREIPIGASVEPALRRLVLQAGDAPVLVGGEDMIERVFLRAKKRLGEPRLSPHALRHSFATNLARKGVTPYVLMGLLGHATLSQLSRYYHAQGDQQRQAVDSLLARTRPDHQPQERPAQDPQAAARAT